MRIFLLVFIFGLMTGSFLNVVIYRLPRKESVVFPGSHCPSCGQRLGFRDLIPVISYLLSRGHCRYCGEKISLQYPVVELSTAIIYLYLYHTYGLSISFFIYLLLVSFLIPTGVIDFQHKIIPNKLTYPGILSGLLLVVFFEHISIKFVLLGLFLPALFLYLLSLLFPGGMGMGDVKLAAMIGTFLGPVYTLLSIFLGAFTGILYTLIIFIVNYKKGKLESLFGTAIPFGFFINIGVLTLIFWGNQLINWYLNIL